MARKIFGWPKPGNNRTNVATCQECEVCYKMTRYGLTEIEPQTGAWMVCDNCLEKHQETQDRQTWNPHPGRA